MLHIDPSMTRPRERERERESKKHHKLPLLITTLTLATLATILITPLGTPIVSAVQNIFTGLGKVKDIQYGGKRVSKVYYRGQIIWEREAPPPVIPGITMQLVTSASCSTVRTRAVDRRDNATYWIQKLADGKCWMLTNLAYDGGGDNTYGDVKNIINSETLDATQPYYMVPYNANKTIEPQDPSTSTDAGAINPQYGYLYNWCAANGVQTAACTGATNPNPNISICPAGWRLPTGGNGGEYQVMAAAIGASTGAAGMAALKSTWLPMSGGVYVGYFQNSGSLGAYWSSTQNGGSGYAFIFSTSNNNISPTLYDAKNKGFSVRCIAI